MKTTIYTNITTRDDVLTVSAKVVEIPVNAVNETAAADALKKTVHGAVLANLYDRMTAANNKVSTTYGKVVETENNPDVKKHTDAVDAYEKATDAAEKAHDKFYVYAATVCGYDDVNMDDICGYAHDDDLTDRIMAAATEKIHDCVNIVKTDNLSAFIGWTLAAVPALSWSDNDGRLADNVARLFKRDDISADDKMYLESLINARVDSRECEFYKNWRWRMTAGFIDDMRKYATNYKTTHGARGRIVKKMPTSADILREFAMRVLQGKFKYRADDADDALVMPTLSDSIRAARRANERAAAVRDDNN